MNLRRLFIVIAITAVVSIGLQGSYLPGDQPGSPVNLRGTFSVLWGDGNRPAAGVRAEYFLTTSQGDTIHLLIDQDALALQGGPVSLNQKAVVVQGNWVDEQRTLQVQSMQLAEGGHSAPQGVYGPQPWVSIMCKFADYPDEPKDKAYFTGMYSSQYPGLNHFWRQNSYNLANLDGSSVAGWFVLPHNREYYLPGGNLDWGTAAAECTGVADPYVDFTPFVGINLMFNAELDGFAWGGGWGLCLDDVCKTWRMTWEPPWGYENIGVIAHETGHGFGLPHSLGNCLQGYDNRWDVLSDVWNNGGDPIYGTMGQHTISYHKELLGWMSPSQVFTATVGTLTTITLEKLALPQTANYLGAVIPIDGSQDHIYTLEVRQPSADPVDYDKWLPGFAVIIHEVSKDLPEPAVVIDRDGDCDTADAGAMYTTGEVFTDLLHHISVSIGSASQTGYTVTVDNRYNAVQAVAITGAGQGNVGESLPFTATVSPISATLPISYTWEATGLPPVQHLGGRLDTVEFSWPDPGTKAITVTASNLAGAVVDTHFIDIASSVPPAQVELDGPDTGIVHAEYTFMARVVPITATLPITYVWQVDAGIPITHTADLSDSLTLGWSTPGLHLVNVTATNRGGTVLDTWSILIYNRVYLPLNLRE